MILINVGMIVQHNGSWSRNGTHYGWNLLCYALRNE